MPDLIPPATPDPAVCAIVVSFEPDLPRLLQLCRRLESMCQFIVVDNGSEPDKIIELRRQLPGKAHLLETMENLGIAAAQNAGVQYAYRKLEQRPQYLLFLDQDSLPIGEMVRQLRETYEATKLLDPKVAALGPALIDRRNQQFQRLHHETMGFYWTRKLAMDGPGNVFRVASVNSSGTFVELGRFNQIGGFREELFIDHVDTEWSYRARHLGYSLYVTTEAVMEHEMGRDLEEIWLFGEKAFPSRAPLRHYYLFRNNIYLLWQEQMTRTWKFWSLIKLSFTFCYFGFLSADRTEQRKMMLRGARAGWKGELGKIS